MQEAWTKRRDIQNKSKRYARILSMACQGVDTQGVLRLLSMEHNDYGEARMNMETAESYDKLIVSLLAFE